VTREEITSTPLVTSNKTASSINYYQALCMLFTSCFYFYFAKCPAECAEISQPQEKKALPVDSTERFCTLISGRFVL
jgi:hypothetical protein